MVPQSPIGKAITYTYNLWPRLKAYIDNGKYEIDNNKIENAIRPLALGRKNYLFAGSHSAAQKAAMMYSFFATCKINVSILLFTHWILPGILGAFQHENKSNRRSCRNTKNRRSVA